MQDMVYGTGRDHQSWVDSATDNSAQRIPCSFIEPVQEIIETMFDHVSCCTVVEPVMFVNPRLELITLGHYVTEMCVSVICKYCIWIVIVGRSVRQYP